MHQNFEVLSQSSIRYLLMQNRNQELRKGFVFQKFYFLERIAGVGTVGITMTVYSKRNTESCILSFEVEMRSTLKKFKFIVDIKTL